VIKDADSEYTYNFPNEIISKFIKYYTHKGEIVFDPFIGSGTTLQVCNELERECIGSEIDSNVYDKFLANNIKSNPKIQWL
jgi:DNA modification methylase